MKKKKLTNSIFNISIITVLLIGLNYLYKAFTYESIIDKIGLEKYMPNIAYFLIFLVFALICATLVITKQVYNIKIKRKYKKPIIN